MTRRRWGIVAVAIIWLLSGGPSIHSIDTIEGQQEFDSNDVHFKLFFHPTFSEHRIPLVFDYFGAGMPAAARFHIHQKGIEFESVVIDELVVVPLNRPAEVSSSKWTSDFFPDSSYVWNPKAGKAEKSKSTYCEGNTDLMIHHYGAYEISIKGRLVRGNRTEEAFASKASVQVVRWNHFGVYPYLFVYLIDSSYKT